MPLINYPFDLNFVALIKRCLWVCLFFSFITISGFAAPRQDHNSIIFSSFKHLSDTAQTRRVEAASNIYKNTCRHLDEPTAMSILDSVELLAKKINDPSLECSIYVLRADYYSVNRGYNSLSIDYHQKAIDFAVEHEMPIEMAIYLHKKGLFYFTFSHNIEACQYFLQAYNKFKQIGLNNIPDVSRYLAEQAQFYYALRDYDTARPLLQLALKYPISQIRIRINLTTAIGLIFRSTGHYPAAIDYFNRALKIAVAHKDTAWIAISKGNIGSVYFMQGDYQKAIPELLVDYQASMHYKEFVNAAKTLLRLSHINIYYKQYAQATARVDSAEAMIKDSKEDVLPVMSEIYNQRSTLCQMAGRYKDAVIYTNKYLASKDSIARRDNIGEIERVKFKFSAENYRNQINNIKTIADVGAFKRNAVIFILFLLIIIFVLLFTRFRLNAKRDQELLMIRKRRVDEKLKNAAESLQLYTENLKQNNALIETFKAEIERFKAQSTDRAGAEHLEKLMQAHIMTDDTWNEFKKLFTKVHGGFFTRLRSTYPYLTDTDMRMLSLVKLGLNNREMANMLGITVEGIKKSKQRLRKKMQLSPEVDIEHIVASF
ncbi:tetratricopeptide repeat protein [Mucilaginibacter boryungensis]|uniref:Tetratricopeptide repeat protein n=1 Tax=Mucilaginibacter boryungensis TaxID=768480 RepID=A0ABR9XM52_9SPHI|nr:tetratricopeptide repeat protein [Mucilaginibacter boryungensis]MBE9668169.1 tetratricopeptide repeat protein [Mucilaginibacter boryungensis]